MQPLARPLDARANYDALLQFARWVRDNRPDGDASEAAVRVEEQPPMGKGLVAARDIAKGEIVVWYGGPYVPCKSIAKVHNTHAFLCPAFQSATWHSRQQYLAPQPPHLLKVVAGVGVLVPAASDSDSDFWFASESADAEEGEGKHEFELPPQMICAASSSHVASCSPDSTSNWTRCVATPPPNARTRALRKATTCSGVICPVSTASRTPPVAPT